MDFRTDNIIVTTPIEVSVAVAKGKAIDYAGALATTTDTMKGVALHEYESGDMATGVMFGEATVLIGASQNIVVGDYLKPTATGVFIEAVATDPYAAIALEAVTTGAGVTAEIRAVVKYGIMP